MDTAEILQEKYKRVKEAEKEWRSLLHITRPKHNDRIVLFPTRDDECNLHGMRYLDTFLQRENARSAVIVTVENRVKREIQNYSDHIKSIIEIEDSQALDLVSLYELHVFDGRFVVVALDMPSSRNGSSLVGYKDITVEQLVAIGIYSIIPFRQLRGDRKIL